MGNILAIEISCHDFFSSLQNCYCRKADYVLQLRENLNGLGNELERLNEEKNDIERRVINAEQDPQMQRTDRVQGWLTRVETVRAEVEQLTNSSQEQIEKLCLGSFCSKNCISSYKFGKAVAEKKRVVATLMKEGDFRVLVERKPNVVVSERPVDPILVGMQSTFEKAWRCIKGKQAGIIGLYGMGGVGKTTLLTQINNHFHYAKNDFDVVIWVVVCKDLRLEKVQEVIGKRIGLHSETWVTKSLEEKASDIYRNLSNKRFLLLLDDIWKRVDLIKVGVPPLSSVVASNKVVFTTRSLDVCGSMNAQETIKVECLSQMEAWELFQAHVGQQTLESHPDIPALAQIVARECDCLPLALITIGRAMAFKETPEEWNYAIQILRRSASNFPGTDEMYPVLKLSYDFLPSKKTKSCFLYCALFPEDYEIVKSELIDLWISEGIIDGYEGSEARNQGHFIIGALTRACLLEKVGDFWVKMHDVIRDLALWIAAEVETENEKFSVHAGTGLTYAPRIGNDRKVKRISWMKNNIKYLLETPSCPKLLTLFLNFNDLEVISNGFFQFMPSLKVLNLSNNQLKELPVDISNLVSLHHLDISYNYIRELPKEFKALVSLEYLNVEGSPELCKIPLGLLPNFLKLKILRIGKCSVEINEMEDNVLGGGGELLVEELLLLEHLNVLAIELRSSSALLRLLSSHNLISCTAALWLHGFQDSGSFSASSLANMKHLQTIHIREVRFLEVGVREYHGFLNLVSVEIVLCSELRDLTWLVLVPNLKRIFLWHCHNVKEIISGEKLADVLKVVKNLNPFAKLEELVLYFLSNLNSIYPIALFAPHLKQIRIDGCPKLKKLPLNVNSTNGNRIIIFGSSYWRQELQWKDEATRNAFLPCIRPFP